MIHPLRWRICSRTWSIFALTCSSGPATRTSSSVPGTPPSRSSMPGHPGPQRHTARPASPPHCRSDPARPGACPASTVSGSPTAVQRYLGTEDEVLVAGPLLQVKAKILQVREQMRQRKGWIMDTYLLRRGQ